ncbi:MAG: hypothetical protein HYZ29_25680 [Myxococcales bacterium]|nr:hypothetical protein [Myxococcales bacterium]
MYAFRRHVCAAAGFLIALLLPAWALAWVETATQSHVVTLDVERDGSATVSHEIVIRVKGGPLPAIELEGVDSDATVLPDATVSAAEGAALTLPLLLEKRDDGTLRAEIDHAKGVSRGKFVFRLAYRTRLGDRGLIRQQGSMAEVRWVAPRSTDGVDSARVLFRLPPGATEPRLPDGDEESGGTFLSNLRRTGDKDELDIVRPHVAKGEPVVWRVLASPRAFDAFGREEAAPPPSALRPVSGERPEQRLFGIAVLATVALLFALVVFAKWRLTTRACRARFAEPRALIPIPAAPRAVAAGGSLAGAVGLVLHTDHATWAGVLLAFAIVLAAQVTPRALPAPRRPGRWLPLGDDEAFRPSTPVLPGRWLDAGTLPGFSVFFLFVIGFGVASVYFFLRSPYHGICVALASAVLLPIFCTGRAGELPPHGATQPAPLLAWLAERLRQSPDLKAVAWARIPEGETAPDELRLLVMPRRAKLGLGAIEFGVEYQGALGGSVALPWVMVRATDGSEAHSALPRTVTWTRGRKPEERSAVLRPKLPTRALCLSLIRSVTATLVERGGPRPKASQPAIKLAMSPGKGSSRAKPAMVSSPAQAT